MEASASPRLSGGIPGDGGRICVPVGEMSDGFGAGMVEDLTDEMSFIAEDAGRKERKKDEKGIENRSDNGKCIRDIAFVFNPLFFFLLSADAVRDGGSVYRGAV